MIRGGIGMEIRDFNNSFDRMFDFDGDGKIDMLEQYAEIDYLAGGKDDSVDADMAYDYLMHSKNPNVLFAAGILGGEDYDDEEDNDDDYDI